MPPYYSFEELNEENQQLVTMAKAALGRAYAPYSRFHVAAAIRLDNSEILVGTNQENAAYPSCMCAERVALYAFSTLNSDRRIREMAVVAKRADHPRLLPVTPCGSCRQVMLEYELRQGSSIRVLLQVEEDQWCLLQSVADLLPFGFSKANLSA
jgi:cytidine deaminase